MKLRGAVVGVGYLGHFHAQKYKALTESTFLNQIEFIGVCDSNFEQSQKVAQSLGVQAFRDPRELLGKVDLVSIAAVTQAHFEIAKLFLENGVHVNVEKPLAATVEQGRKLVELAKQKSLVLTVGHSERFAASFKALEDRKLKPVDLILQRYAPYKARGADVSVVHDLMIHDLDLAFQLDKSKPQLINAWGGRLLSPTLDWARCELSFASGARALISVSRLAATMTRTCKLVSAEEVLEANLQTGDFSRIWKNENLEIQVDVQNFGKSDNLMTETQVFFASVLGQAKAAITAEQGLAALEFSDDVVRWIENKATLKI